MSAYPPPPPPRRLPRRRVTRLDERRAGARRLELVRLRLRLFAISRPFFLNWYFFKCDIDRMCLRRAFLRIAFVLLRRRFFAI